MGLTFFWNQYLFFGHWVINGVLVVRESVSWVYGWIDGLMRGYGRGGGGR